VSHTSRQWISNGLAVDGTTHKLIEETKNLLELVCRRLELEESELYSVVDPIRERSGTWPVDSTDEPDETSKTG
jgi:hypothetical protein